MRIPPLIKAAATSGSIMAAGDVLCQKLRARGEPRERALDLRQTVRFATVGCLLHGPFFYTGFRWLDRLGARHPAFAGRSPLSAALMKTALGQVTLFPTYTVAVFAALGLLEGLTAAQCREKVAAAVPTTLLSGTVFWPVVNVFNFLFVPPSMRLLYVNGCGLAWNSYLSWQNVTKGSAAAAVRYADEHARDKARKAAQFDPQKLK